MQNSIMQKSIMQNEINLQETCEAITPIEQDPRNCPKCKARGKRPYRKKRLLEKELIWAWLCPNCGTKWCTSMRLKYVYA